MHEQSDSYRLIDDILDHPRNAGRDAHELRALHERLKRMSFADLERELSRLDESRPKAARIMPTYGR